MKVIAHINKVRFIVEEKGKFYVVSIPKKESTVIDRPDDILRQGYWENGYKLNKEEEEMIKNLIK